jgi:hypothetical protein
MNRLQKPDSGPNLPKFSANRAAMPLKFEKIWPCCHTFSLRSPNFQTGSKTVLLGKYEPAQRLNLMGYFEPMSCVQTFWRVVQINNFLCHVLVLNQNLILGGDQVERICNTGNVHLLLIVCFRKSSGQKLKSKDCKNESISHLSCRLISFLLILFQWLKL